MPSPKLELDYLEEGQSEPEVTENDNWNRVDALLHLAIIDRDLVAQPASPSNGDAYLLTVTPTGTHWSGQGNKLAFYYDGWRFLTPEEGFVARVKDENISIMYDGAAWATFGSGSSTLNNDAATTAPTANEDSGDGYAVGSRWTDVTADVTYICVDATVAAAKWAKITPRHLKMFRPQENEYTGSNPATADTINGHPVLDFDQTTQEIAMFAGIMPDHYRGGSIKVSLYWIAEANTGTVGWDVSFEYTADGVTINADSFATAQTVTAATVPGTTNLLKITTVTITNANADAVVAGGFYRMRVRRDVANDTCAADAALRAAVLEEV